jgi:hypothetical protein
MGLVAIRRLPGAHYHVYLAEASNTTLQPKLTVLYR